MLTDFLDNKHVHAFGLTELSYLFLIVIDPNHDQFITYERRAALALSSDQTIWLPPPFAGHNVGWCAKSSSADPKRGTGRRQQRFPGPAQKPSAHQRPVSRSTGARRQAGTQIMDSQEGTPCAGPCQGCSRRASAPGSRGKPVKIGQGEFHNWGGSYCLGVRDPLWDGGEEHLGIARDLWDV